MLLVFLKTKEFMSFYSNSLKVIENASFSIFVKLISLISSSNKRRGELFQIKMFNLS